MTTTHTTLAEGSIAHGLAAGGDLRWASADIGDAVETLRVRRDLSPLAAVSIGQLLAGAVLIHRLVAKGGLRLSLEVRGDGPLGRLLAEVDEEGRLRGSVDEVHAESEDGRLGIAAGIGRGTLRVVRRTVKGTYESQVELVPAGIGETLTHFLEQSEQIRAAVLLGVLARPTGIAAAGGLVVEALPGADADVLRGVEERIAARSGVSRLLEQGGREALLDDVLGELDREVLEHSTVIYACTCSRESLLERLRELPVEDLEYLEQQGVAETDVECTYCGSHYIFAAEELRSIQ